MKTITVRKLPDATHRALTLRARQHGRSTAAEIRAILASAVQPDTRPRLGTALRELSRSLGLANADVDAIEQNFDRTPAEPMTFE